MEHVNETFLQAEAHAKQSLEISPETVQRLHQKVMREIHITKKSPRSKWVKVSVATLAAAGALTIALPQLLHGMQGTGETVNVHSGARENGPIRHDIPVDPVYSTTIHTVSDGTSVQEINAKNDGFDKAVEVVKKRAGFDLYLPQVKKLNMSSLQYIEHMTSPDKNLVDFNYYLVDDKAQLKDLTAWFSEAKNNSAHAIDDLKKDPRVKPVQVKDVTWYVEKKTLQGAPTSPSITELEYTTQRGDTTIFVRLPETFNDPETFLASFQKVN